MITEENQVRQIMNLIGSYTGPFGTGFQYSIIRKVPGASSDAIIMPEADRRLALKLTNDAPDADKVDCKRILARRNLVYCHHGLG